MPHPERRGPPEGIATASLQFKIEPEGVRWLHAALGHQQETHLFNDDFPGPFTHLDYMVVQNQGQLIFVADLGLGAEFQERYGIGVGSEEDLAPLLQRYPEHYFVENNQRLVVARNGEIQGTIARVAEDRIIIQWGGQAGQVNLSEKTPVNSLAVSVDRFNLLVQRYVSSIWRNSSETNQKQMQFILELPGLPEGAIKTYLSTFEIVGRDFLEHPRNIDLDNGIGGYPRMREIIKGLILDTTDPDISRSFGTQPFNNKLVLATGAEGTGKSLYPKSLYWELRGRLGADVEYYRLPIDGMLVKFGEHTSDVIKTILDHAKQNEKNGVPTIIHLDSLQALVPPNHRSGRDVTVGPTGAELAHALNTVNPIILVLQDFGKVIGGQSHHVIVYGESREPRELLPEGVHRMFRRSVSLDNPNIDDLADILRVQIGTTRSFAEGTGHDLV